MLRRSALILRAFFQPIDEQDLNHFDLSLNACCERNDGDNQPRQPL
jgi:hypothetical protein